MKAVSNQTLNQTQLREANIPKKFWKTGLDDVYLPSPELRALRKFVLQFKAASEEASGMILTGASQSGKTSIMNLVLKSLMAKGHSTLYIRGDDLVNRHFNRETEASDFDYSDVLRVDVLGIDDLVTNGNAGYPIALANVLRTRSNDQKPTILCWASTDTTMTEFESEYGAELAHFVANGYVSMNLVYNESFIKRASDR